MENIPRSKLLKDIIKKAAENIYAVPRIGQIVSDSDPESLYRFLVQVPSLGWDTNDKAAWCYVSDKKGYASPKVGDYVIVQFMDGKIDNAFISGCANHMRNMISKLYNSNTDVIYEVPDVIRILHDRQANEMQIGNSLFKYAARKDDAIQSTSTEDAIFWTWIAAAGVVLAGLGVAVPIPTTLTGKITGGSNQIKIGDK